MIKDIIIWAAILGILYGLMRIFFGFETTVMTGIVTILITLNLKEEEK